MKHPWKLPAFGVLLAIAATSAMDACGPRVSRFSSLALTPLTVLFWSLERMSWTEIGFVLGRARYIGLALLHPALVLGFTALIAWFTGAIHLEETNWTKKGGELGVGLLLVAIMLVLALVTTGVAAALQRIKGGWLKRALQVTHAVFGSLLVINLIEECFFRGWLWASLKRSGQTTRGVLIWSSLAFSLWHWSAVLLDTGFNPPLIQVPTFMVNAVFLGLIWGMLRLVSGSVVIASVGHGVWNAMDYVFFGFGQHHGALGIQETGLYGPEVGLLGLILNAMFAAGLWHWYQVHQASDSGGNGVAPGGGVPLPART